MLKRIWPTVVILVLSIGPERGVGGDPDNVSLQRVLEKEAKGEVVDRVVELMNVRESVPLDAVRWQSGQLRNKNQWIAVEAIGKEAGEDDPKLDRYRKERGKSPLNLEGHLRMARWCSEHKLQEQEVAHWHGVLGLPLIIHLRERDWATPSWMVDGLANRRSSSLASRAAN